MERRLPLIILIFIFSLFSNFAQNLAQKENIQLFLWAGLDAYPEIYEEDKENYPGEKPYTIPVQKIKEIGPFLLEGMTFGWEFTYVPYDKTRNVSEFFERKSINSFEPFKKQIIYKQPAVKDEKLCVWIEFVRTPKMLSYYKFWENMRHDKIHGKGEAPLIKGFDGIQEACAQALKQAVREYFRTQLKNKPKELSGKVLMTSLPRISTSSGKYVVNLDFFIETDRIVQYTQF